MTTKDSMQVAVFPLTSRKTPAITGNWQEYRGRADTQMIGVGIPDGLFVIDADLYKDVTLSQIDEVLGCALPWDDAELQHTMRGGRHYAFRVPMGANLINGADVFKLKGFDTRAAGKGYIATGKGYTLISFLHDSVEEALSDPMAWPELPAAALAKVTKGEVVAGCDGEDLLTAIASQTLDITPAQARRYVEALPDECADDAWLSVGMAIKHQLGDDGWELFDEFSRRCPEKYNESTNRKRWDSFSSDGGAQVTFASVIKLAGGSTGDIAQEIARLDISEKITAALTVESVNALLAEVAAARFDKMARSDIHRLLQTKYTTITGNKPSLHDIKAAIKASRSKKTADASFVEDYVFVTTTCEWMRRDTKISMKCRAFDVENSGRTPLTADGDKQSATTFAMDKIEKVDRTMYFPAAGEVFIHAGVRYINTYTEPDIELVPVGTSDIVPRIKAHIAHLLTDEREQNIVIDYLAHNVQRPGTKLHWAIVLQGVQGDGKSLFAELMQMVMGVDNVRTMAVDTLESGFTGWATGQCMTFIEELKLDNTRKYEVLNKLKMYVSNPTVEEHRKGKDPITVVNTTNYIALTNFKDAIPIDTTDRRYCILFSQWQRKSELEKFMEANPNYYPDLYYAMRNSAGELRQWLLEWNISKDFINATRAPATKAKEQMTELSKSDGMIALEYALERYHNDCSLGGGEIDITRLQKLVDTENLSSLDKSSILAGFPARNALKNCLLNLGYEWLDRRRTIYSEDGDKHTTYRL